MGNVCDSANYVTGKRSGWCSPGVVPQNPLRFGSRQHATRTEVQLGPTRTENIIFQYHQLTIKKCIHSSTLQLYSQRIGIVLLMTLFIHCSLSTSGITSYHQLYLRYSTNSGERESRPFLDEPETSVYFNQHYSSALGLFCYVLPARLPTGTGQESSICWSLTILRRRNRRHDVTWQKYNQLSTWSQLFINFRNDGVGLSESEWTRNFAHQPR